MNCRKRIVEIYLQQKKDKKFTGSIKLSFENGRIVSISEANRHEFPLSAVASPDDIDRCFDMSEEPLFNGSVAFVFDAGIIKQYSYSRSYKGDSLRKFLGVLDANLC